MHTAAIRFAVLAPDDGDGLFHLQISASNGGFSAQEDFYAYLESISVFGKALADFPSSRLAAFEYGSLEGNSDCFIRLRAYLRDAVGHAAIEVWTDNRRTGNHLARATFQIFCEVSAINRLGSDLVKWISEPRSPMFWEPQQARA